MTSLGLLALMCSAAAIALRRPRFHAAALGFAAGVPASAGFTVGAVSVPLFTTVALVTTASFAISRGAALPPLRDVGCSLLVAFVCWSLVLTVVGPWAFSGLPVLEPRKGVDEQVHAPSALHFTVSHAAQAVYLVSAVLAGRFLWRSGTASLALSTAAWTGTVLSAARGVLRSRGLDRTAPIFDTLAVDYSSDRDTRLRGVFAEPSELATFSLAVLTFAAVSTLQAPTRRKRVSSAVLALLAMVNLLASGSGTAVAGGVVVTVGMSALIARRFVASHGRHTPAVVLMVLAISFVTVWFGPDLVEPVGRLVTDKLGSQSFNARSAADGIGLDVVARTRGLGAGLGSNRSSSFLVTLSSTTGVLGLALFAASIVAVVRAASVRRAAVPAAAGVLGMLVAKAVATPDLSTPLLWILIATCFDLAGRRVEDEDTSGSRHLVHGRHRGSTIGDRRALARLGGGQAL